MNRKRLFLAVVSIGSILASGCATGVRPWERGYLAEKHMAVEPDPLAAAIREQAVTSKEASEGGGGVVGGGCGCN